MILDLNEDKLLHLMIAVDCMAALNGKPSLTGTSTEDSSESETNSLYKGWQKAIEFLFSNPKLLVRAGEIVNRSLEAKVGLPERVRAENLRVEKIVKESEENT